MLNDKLDLNITKTIICLWQIVIKVCTFDPIVRLLFVIL